MLCHCETLKEAWQSHLIVCPYRLVCSILSVIPAKACARVGGVAGIQGYQHIRQYRSTQRKPFLDFWIPAFAGMTDVMSRGRLLNAELMGIETWTISCSKSTTLILPDTQKRDEPGP